MTGFCWLPLAFTGLSSSNEVSPVRPGIRSVGISKKYFTFLFLPFPSPKGRNTGIEPEGGPLQIPPNLAPWQPLRPCVVNQKTFSPSFTLICSHLPSFTLMNENKSTTQPVHGPLQIPPNLAPLRPLRPCVVNQKTNFTTLQCLLMPFNALTVPY